MKVLRASCVCGAIAALGACAGGTAGGGGGGAADIDSVPVLTIRRDLRVGSADSPDAGFSRMGALTVGPDGLVYVEERQDRQIRVYDPSGRRLRTIGGKGDGPGEFQSLRALGFKGDTLWVSDPSAERITLFSPVGDVLGTIRTRGVSLRIDHRAEVVEQGSYLLADGRIGFTFTSARAGPGQMLGLRVPDLVSDRSGQALDTVGWEVLPSLGRRTIKLAGRPVVVPGPSSDSPFLVHLSNGRVEVDRKAATDPDSAILIVTRTGPAGDTLYRREYRYRPAGFSPAFVETLVGEQAHWSARSTGLDSVAVARAIHSALDLPRFQAPVSLVRVGADGSVWLRREDDGGPTFGWVVLDPQGDAIGRFELPRSVTILWARMGELYGSDVDSLGVPWLVRYRVAGA
jgi:hypothetical protein